MKLNRLSGSWLLCITVFLCPQFGYASSLHLQILDDHGNGMECNLFLLDERGQESAIGKTDEQGRTILENGFKRGEILKVVPVQDTHFPTLRRFPMEGSVWVLITEKALFEHLKANAQFMENQGNYGEAALIYNEMMMRARGFDAASAEVFRLKVLEMFGKLLGIQEPFAVDPVQSRKVITPEFKKAIQKYQRDKGLGGSGRIDYGTLSAAARRPVSHYLFNPPPANP